MANPNKRKGTEWESAVRDYLNATLGLYVEDWRDAASPWKDAADPHNVKRQVQMSTKDVGDLHAVPFVLEAKAERDIDLPAYIRQANREAVNAGLPYGVAVVKARGKQTKDGYVVCDLATFARILRALREN